MATSFDPAVFLNQEYDEALDTRVIPCPAGEALGIADKVDIIPWESTSKGTSGLKAKIFWDIQDDTVRQFTGRDKVLVPQDIMLDLTDTGQLDFGKGKNTRLGRLREALDLNQPGKPFSFGMITGRMANVNVVHRPDPRDPENVFAEVDRVAKAS